MSSAGLAAGFRVKNQETVGSTLTVQGNAFSVGGTVNVDNGTLTVGSGGNVGIGTTNPGHKLDVSGSYFSELVNDGSPTSTLTIDWNAGNVQYVTPAGNVTLTFTNGQSGGRYVLVLKQDATGSRTVTWPASARFSGGTAPTLTAVAGKTDYVGFLYNGLDAKYDNVAFYPNF